MYKLRKICCDGRLFLDFSNFLKSWSRKVDLRVKSGLCLVILKDRFFRKKFEVMLVRELFLVNEEDVEE